MAAAVAAGQLGCEVTLAEREPLLGGQAVAYACKATDRCLHCGVCLVSDLQEELAASPVTVRMGTTLRALEGRPGAFRVELSDGALETGAVIVASGMTPAPAAEWPDLGYGRLPGVLTGTDLEQTVRRGESPAGEEIAFVQCVGSRCPSRGRDYCSEVCCPYALRLALVLLADRPDRKLTVFYNDLQTAGRVTPNLYEQAREKIRLIQGIPARITVVDGRLALVHEDIRQGTMARDLFDQVVLSVGIWPRPEAPDLARALGINLDGSGFFAGRPGANWLSSRPGVFLAGCCQKPRNLADSIAHARAAATAAAAARREVKVG
jgi:heterodisulfide reductase subunit A